jgi:hypothetical protein
VLNQDDDDPRRGTGEDVTKQSGRSDSPGSWTARDVERWLVIPMRLLYDGPLVVLPGNVHRPTLPNAQPSHFDILAFARTVLGAGTPELLAIVTWARIKARAGDPDSSIASWCREMGWRERTFYRRKDRALARVAQAKNVTDLAMGRKNQQS